MYYVMSDVHGCHKALEKALVYWNPEKETLVVLGDLIDRGPNSKDVVDTLYRLQKEHGDRVVVLKGNHDQSFAAWLLDTDPYDLGHYYLPSHNETTLSFFDHNKKKYKKSTRTQRGQHVLHTYGHLVRYLYDLPDYHETEHVLFVHAGVNLGLGEKWRRDVSCMNRTRGAFYNSRIPAPKKTFFGHTPTPLVRNQTNEADYDYSVWVSPGGDKICVDGGVSMGGQLNALKVDASGNILKTLAFVGD